MGQVPENLVGIGLYTPAEAGRLIQVAPGKIVRWLKGHNLKGKHYDPLWRPQVDLGDGSIYLGFRDLMEVRVVAAFIAKGLHPIKVRQAIKLAGEIVGDERPLSTTWFRTDGRSVFLQMAGDDGQTQLIDLFKSQHVFREIVEQSLKGIDYDLDGVPARWWPLGKSKHILVDPERSFGKPIEAESSVPTDVLAAAAEAEGSVETAARVWSVPVRSVRRAVAFQAELEHRKAA